ncbi:MAG: DUF1330 domain-containing protein [Gammaproteobacteria bacterium]|jgi:uncharacterized protein (DUF1330 family)
MSAYIIASYDIVDEKGMESYVPGVTPLLMKHHAEVLVASYNAHALEGEKRGVYVVLRFASDEAALAWYNDPEYAPLKKMRIDASDNANVVLAREFVPPSG